MPPAAAGLRARDGREGDPVPNVLKCVECGAAYPLGAVQHLDKFPCSKCGRAIVVPIAGPSAARASGEPRPESPSEPPPLPAAPAAPGRRAAPRQVEPAPVTAPRRGAPRVAQHRTTPGRMKPLRGLSYAVFAALAVALVVQVVSAIGHLELIDFADGIAQGATPDAARAAEIDARAQVVAVWIIVIALVAAVPFCAWFHRAHANLRAARLDHLQYASGWAIGGFFVPFLNLVRPFQVMTEVWAGTAYLAGVARVAKWRNARASSWVRCWWGLLLCGGGASVAGAFVLGSSQNAAGVAASGWFALTASLLRASSVLCAVEVVRRITELQEQATARSPAE
jgi:hypothetical protein